MSNKVALYEIPYTDSGSLSDAILEYPDALGSLVLRFEYERDEKWYFGKFCFGKARCFRFHAEGHAAICDTEGAFDTLVEVQASTWAQEVASSSPHAGGWILRHYMVLISSMGVYEVLAAGWNVYEEEKH